MTSPGSPSPTPPESEERPLKTMMVVGALGFELVGMILGGATVGYLLDERWHTAPWLLLTGLGLGMLSGGLHVSLIIRRFMRHQDGTAS